jgi:hypothetical protein
MSKICPIAKMLHLNLNQGLVTLKKIIPIIGLKDTS